LSIIPIAASLVPLRNPSDPRSQLGVAAVKHARSVESEPKMLRPTHARPAAPRFPNVSCSAVSEPVRADKAVISTRFVHLPLIAPPVAIAT